VQQGLQLVVWVLGGLVIAVEMCCLQESAAVSCSTGGS
jgi:hypothetical protein